MLSIFENLRIKGQGHYISRQIFKVKSYGHNMTKNYLHVHMSVCPDFHSCDNPREHVENLFSFWGKIKCEITTNQIALYALATLWPNDNYHAEIKYMYHIEMCLYDMHRPGGEDLWKIYASHKICLDNTPRAAILVYLLDCWLNCSGEKLRSEPSLHSYMNKKQN